jgi:hypothetical protein
MTADTSWLFRSIAYIFLRNAEEHSSLRRIVANSIIDDPIQFNQGWFINETL